MLSEMLSYLFQHHLGKIVGGLGGFVFGLLAITYGIFKAIFVVFCAVVGYYIGKRADAVGSFKALISKVWGE